MRCVTPRNIPIPKFSGPRRTTRFGLPGTQNFRKILGSGLCPLKDWASSAASSYTRLPKFLAPSSPKPRPLNFRKIWVIACLNSPTIFSSKIFGKFRKRLGYTSCRIIWSSPYLSVICFIRFPYYLIHREISSVPSLCFSLSVSFSVSLSLSVSLSHSVFLSISLVLCLFLCLSLISLSLFRSYCVSFSISLSVSLSLCLSLSLSLCLSL